jgi:hypothetical protein
MSGLRTHSGLILADLATHRGLANLATIDGLALAAGSAPGVPEEVVVSGAGSSGTNGTYAYLDTYTGRPWYRKVGSGGNPDHYIWYDYQWRISYDAGAWPTVAGWVYRNPATDALPPVGDWLVDTDGSAPAPTLSY